MLKNMSDPPWDRKAWRECDVDDVNILVHAVLRSLTLEIVVEAESDENMDRRVEAMYLIINWQRKENHSHPVLFSCSWSSAAGVTLTLQHNIWTASVKKRRNKR